ncbi:MAG: CotH kinase family protein, partial [Owenweeksia sp.]
KIRFEKHRVAGKYHKKNPGASDALIQLNQAAPEKYYPLSWKVAPASHAEVYEPKLDDLGGTSSVYTEINNWYTEWGNRSNVIYQNYVLPKDTVVPDSLLRKLRAQTDYQSFATYFLINELAKDQDGYHKSTFMVKRDSVCYAGPLWDKNKSYGNLFNNPDSTSFYNSPAGWLYKDGTKTKNPDANQSPQWWSAMLLDPVFCDTVWSQWNRYKTALLDTASMNGFIDSQVKFLSTPTSKAKNLESALLRNNACWQNGSNLTIEKYDQQVNELKSYLGARIPWMDTNLPKLLRKSGFRIPSK